MAETVRVFIAISIPDPVLDGFGEVQTGIRRHGFKIRWVRPESIHLTLKFLGDILAADIAGVRQTLVETVSLFPPLTLCAKGVGVFPGIKRPRVIWVGLGGETAPLGRLQKALEDGLAAIGFPKETRPFTGHLTLGRFKGRVDPSRLGDAIVHSHLFESPAFKVREIHLIQSRLKPGGAQYTRLFSVNLEGG